MIGGLLVFILMAEVCLAQNEKITNSLGILMVFFAFVSAICSVIEMVNVACDSTVSTNK